MIPTQKTDHNDRVLLITVMVCVFVCVQSASEKVLDALEEGNMNYEKKFGHIFLVCATGKSAEEMLGLLNARMTNPPEEEILVAAGEQAKISFLRIEKLLLKHGSGSSL